MIKAVCPISTRRVNEKAVQLNAAFTVLAMIFFFLTVHKWLIGVLFIDFLIRGFFNPAYSFFSAVSKMVLRIFKIQPSMANAGPKIFAAKIGFVFCCLIAGFYLVHCRAISLTLASVFTTCAALEAFFRICIACMIYPYIYGIKASD
jgi:hypothetical protein